MAHSLPQPGPRHGPVFGTLSAMSHGIVTMLRDPAWPSGAWGEAIGAGPGDLGTPGPWGLAGLAIFWILFVFDTIVDIGY